jgi:exopolysaccharide biosynthesis polyprenyl glycosylphosphotransferase
VEIKGRTPETAEPSWGRGMHPDAVPTGHELHGTRPVLASADTLDTASPVLAEALSVLDGSDQNAVVRRRGWLVRRILFLADLLGTSLAVLVTQRLGGTSALFFLCIPLALFLAKLYGMYSRDEERANHTTVDDLSGVFHMFTVESFLLIPIGLVFGATIDLRDIVLFWGFGIVFVTGFRVAGRSIAHRSASYLQNTLILGAGDVGQLIARKVLQHPEYGINLVGLVDASPKEQRPDLGDLTIVGTADDLSELVEELDIERLIVAFSGESNEDTLDLVRGLRDYPIQIDIVPRLFEALGPSAEIHTIEGLPLVGLPSIRITRTSRWMKRGLDILVAGSLVVLLAPLMAFIALRIRRDSSGPAVFRQDRLGINMRPFTMFKFRTMWIETDAAVHREYIGAAMDPSVAPIANGLYKLERNDAVTPVGRWLRRTSLDELPQLFNVIRGEMSLVGPRPCLPYETEFFKPYHFERFLVPQGVTGLWQVEGRSLMTPREAYDLDVAYARGWSLGLDMSLLLRTFRRVFDRDGAS